MADFACYEYAVIAYVLMCLLRDFVGAFRFIVNSLQTIRSKVLCSTSSPATPTPCVDMCPSLTSLAQVQTFQKTARDVNIGDIGEEALDFVFQLSASHKVHLFRNCLSNCADIKAYPVCGNCLKKIHKKK
jgi:hypothetical protein